MVSNQKLAVLLSGMIVVASCQRPPGPEHGWENTIPQGLEPEAGAKQSNTAGLGLVIAPLVIAALAPLLANLATGILNGMTATANNRTLEYIPVPSLSEVVSKGSYGYADEGYPAQYYRTSKLLNSDDQERRRLHQASEDRAQ